MNQDNDNSLDTSPFPTQNPGLFDNFALLGGFNGLGLNGANVLNGLNNFQNNNTYTPPTNNNQLEEQVKNTEFEANRIQDDNNDLMGENVRLRMEIERLNNLLKQPLREIAKQDATFAKNYSAEKETLATWMVSQKAFQELAIQLGEANGINSKEIIKKGLSMVGGVLSSSYSPSHGTNGGDQFLQFYKNKLVEKFPENDKDSIISKIEKIRNSATANASPTLKNQF